MYIFTHAPQTLSYIYFVNIYMYMRKPRACTFCFFTSFFFFLTSYSTFFLFLFLLSHLRFHLLLFSLSLCETCILLNFQFTNVYFSLLQRFYSQPYSRVKKSLWPRSDLSIYTTQASFVLFQHKAFIISFVCINAIRVAFFFSSVHAFREIWKTLATQRTVYKRAMRRGSRGYHICS